MPTRNRLRREGRDGVAADVPAGDVAVCATSHRMGTGTWPPSAIPEAVFDSEGIDLDSTERAAGGAAARRHGGPHFAGRQGDICDPGVRRTSTPPPGRRQALHHGREEAVSRFPTPA
ncbi:hypothetical protein GCM10022416_03120 [Actinomadura keratinilytica]|uniref:Uncharacterized protein n=1 Tax=Actinomadura keratinilytica TaxID=547461 RepID=A0ABP7XYS5_9ACTN